MLHMHPPAFDLDQLEYKLPQELIAQSPPPRRDDARLLAVNRASGAIEDRQIQDLPELLRPGDLLVLNDTKVVPARFFAHRKTGGRASGLFLHSPSPGVWAVLLESSGRLMPGEALQITNPESSGPTVELRLLEKLDAGRWLLRVDDGGSPERLLAAIGRTPLPPYIRRDSQLPPAEPADRDRYQTVYASKPGAVAAPTAGLHFTEPLLDRIRAGGVDVAFVTLHVGMGTFKPITAANIADHVMHAERYELPAATADAINACRTRGGRVVAVGTTTVRVLESAGKPRALVRADPRTERSREQQVQGETSLFIYPPSQFAVVDALLTNFHLPRSTLLALVMALAGVEQTRRAYEHAISRRYRFYSYGDAMWIA